MRRFLFFMPNAQNHDASTYIFGDYNYKLKDMVLLDLMYNWHDIALQVEPIRAGGVIPLIAAGISAISNIWGANKAAKNSKEANEAATDEMNTQKSQNEAWYNQKMNENYLDTAEAQAALTKAQEMAKEQMAAARGRQAVMGGTDASIAATQQSVNKMLAETTSGLAATGTARKDAFDQTYLNRNNELSRQLIDMYGQKAANSAAAGSSALGALGNIGSALITAFGGSGS